MKSSNSNHNIFRAGDVLYRQRTAVICQDNVAVIGKNWAIRNVKYADKLEFVPPAGQYLYLIFGAGSRQQGEVFAITIYRPGHIFNMINDFLIPDSQLLSYDKRSSMNIHDHLLP